MKKVFSFKIFILILLPPMNKNILKIHANPHRVQTNNVSPPLDFQTNKCITPYKYVAIVIIITSLDEARGWLVSVNRCGTARGWFQCTSGSTFGRTSTGKRFRSILVEIRLVSIHLGVNLWPRTDRL